MPQAKDQAYMLWLATTTGNGLLSHAGQQHCYDESGQIVKCGKTGQTGQYRHGLQWPEALFECRPYRVVYQHTGLLWRRNADLVSRPVNRGDARAPFARLNTEGTSTSRRLPDINELESLVNCAAYKPALAARHPFSSVRDICWFATIRRYRPGRAAALYLDKVAAGVAYKSFARFHVWAVTDAL